MLELVGNNSDDVEPATDYIPFLSSPVLVTGAFLLSNGNCTLASSLRVNISSEENTGMMETELKKFVHTLS